jgi:hypothetical protein
MLSCAGGELHTIPIKHYIHINLIIDRSNTSIYGWIAFDAPSDELESRNPKSICSVGVELNPFGWRQPRLQTKVPLLQGCFWNQ